MAISDKLNYLIETKQLFKDRLNSLGAEIIESTTFRNYLNWLDTFYGEVSDKTDLSINGVVGRTSQENTTGKNLFDSSLQTTSKSGITCTANNDGTYTLNGTATSNINIDIFPSNTIPAGTYKVVGCPREGSNTTYYLATRFDGNWGNRDTGSGAIITFTNFGKLSLYIASGVTFSNAILKPMITADTSLTYDDYEPYTNGASPNPDYPQEINNLSGDVEYKVSGKNLINIVDFVGVDKDLKPLRKWSIINNNTIQCQTTPTQKSYFDEVPLDLPSGTYTISGTYTNSLNLSDTNDIMIRIRNSGGQPKSTTYTATYDKSSGDKFSLLFYKNKNNDTAIGQTITETFTNVQLEENSTSSDYEPYISESFPLSLGDIELCNISDYKDRIYSQNGEFYLEKKNGKVVLDGSEDWSKSSNTSVDRFLRSSTIPKATQGISNYFNVVTSLGTNVGTFYFNERQQVVNYSTYGTTTLATFKTWLSTHNTIVYYVLATPTTTEITQENYPTLYSQLLAIQEFLTKYKINKEFLLDYSSPEIEY